MIATREMSYIKPLNGAIGKQSKGTHKRCMKLKPNAGPRSTKCLLTDEILRRDLEDFVTQETTTQTPDVPSGSSFCIKTRTCLMWAGKGQVRMLVTVLVDFFKSLWLKCKLNLNG